MLFLFAVISLSSLGLSTSSSVVLTINYPDSELNSSYVDTYDVVFNLNLYSCMENHLTADGQGYTFGGASCPGGEWFAGDSNSQNYIVRPADRVGPNEFQKTIDLGSEYTGIFFISINNDYRPDAGGEMMSSLPVCSTVPEMQLFCSQNGSPYAGMITSVTDVVELNTYPWFGMQNPGETYAILPNYASTFPGSTVPSRDIIAYVPASVSQNSLRRKVNVMVVNDGSLDEVSSYVFYGFELGQQTGVVPESLLVGIPQTGDYCNRQYELSNSVCLPGWSKYNRYTDPPTTSAYYGCPGNGECPITGGNDNYLTWIYQEVLPAVLDELGMALGEVSIVGGSMGGLTACYAPSKFPNWYSRGFCYAPAVMWNYGDMAEIVKNNFKETNALPKSIVMEIGHEAYDIFRNDSTGESRNMLQIHKDVFDAYLSIGMDTMSFSRVVLTPSGDNSQTVNILGAAPQHMAMFYDQRAAFHAPSNWMVSFFTHLQVLYRPSYNDSTRMQRSDYDWYLGQPLDTYPSFSLDDDDSEKKLFALGLGLGLAVGVLGLALAGTCCCLFCLKKAPSLLSSDAADKL